MTARAALGGCQRGLARGLGRAVAAAVGSSEGTSMAYWPYVTEALSMVPFALGCQLREEVYRRCGGGCGEGTVIHHGVTIEDRRTCFGRHVWVSAKAYLDYVILDDHVLVGPHAVLLSGRRHHRANRVDVPVKQQGNLPKEPLHVGEGAWIGANATVMADVGRHAIVGAGAVVVDPVPDFAVVVGNPARVVRDRRQAEGDR